MEWIKDKAHVEIFPTEHLCIHRQNPLRYLISD